MDMKLPEWADCFLISSSEFIPASEHENSDGELTYRNEQGELINMDSREVYQPDETLGAVIIIALIAMMALALFTASLL